MEIHVVDRDNAHLYRDLLDLNFRLRVEVFVDQLKWRACRAVDGRERDQFDTDDATYFFAVENGGLAGSIRRHCTLDPTLMNSVFAHVAQRGFERAPDVYESTRQYILKPWSDVHPCQVAGYLQRALWAWTLQERGRLVQFITWDWYVRVLNRSGLRLRPLGLPTPHEDMHLMAVASPVSPEVLEDLTAFYDLGPAPFRRDGFSPAARQAA